MLKEFKVSNAIPYIRSCLLAGNTLAQHLLDLPLNHGQVVTYLPPDTSLQAIEQLESGHVANRQETKQALAALVTAYLREHDTNYALFEPIVRLGDPAFNPSKEQFWSYKLEVYNFVYSQNIGSELIYRTVSRLARPYPFVGILTSLPNSQPILPNKHQLSLTDLDMLVKLTRRILIGAYDDEAVLIWSID